MLAAQLPFFGAGLGDKAATGYIGRAPPTITELRPELYGLYAVMHLHNAQEEENAFSLIPATWPGGLRR